MGNGAFDGIEVGSNVFELIEFSLDRKLANGEITTGRYGVNVAKVREVVRMPKINPLASTIPGVAGVFELRGIPIPAINLAVALGDTSSPIVEEQQIIVTEFSLKRAGFIVKNTQRIRRIAWEKVLPPTADKHTCINGMTLVENNEFLFILDLEKILFEVEKKGGYINPLLENSQMSGSSGAERPMADAGRGSAQAKGVRILLVDDSDIILKNVKNFLVREGYDVTRATNGHEAKEILEAQLSGDARSGKIDILVSDVEMPKMDGLTLTKWVREQEQLRDLPVILHTSLSGEANLSSGKQVGANAYVVKNDIHSLLDILGDFRKGSKPPS